MRPKLNQQPNGSSMVPSTSAPVTSGSVTQSAGNSSTYTPSTSGIVNPVFVSDLVESNVAPARAAPPAVPPKPSKQPLHKQRSSTSTTVSESSSDSTVLTTASDNRRTLTTSSVEIGDQHSEPHTSSKHLAIVDPSCDYCYRFHVNNHRTGHRPKSVSHHQQPIGPAQVPSYNYQPSYAPYPPQWYYLLAADTKQFRKHKHSHYRRDCKVCRQIVRQTFEQYYLRNNLNTMHSSGRVSDRVDGSGSDSPDSGSLVPVSLMSDHHSDPLLESAPASSTASPLPLVFLPRRRANCGHSCLKYSILFYCSVAVILAICFICYLTKMFGYLEVMPSLASDQTVTITSSPEPALGARNDSSSADFFFTTTIASSMSSDPSPVGTASSLFDLVRFEVIGIIVCSALMIIFFLGLIGAFLESVLCLRIFGAILSYLFLLTFGAALYIIILLVISRVPAKLVLSTVSCSAVAITLHAALAIAPFAFADLIYQERQDDKNELSSTYVKYPSVRFLPSGGSAFGGKGRSQFSLPFLGSGSRVWGSRAFLGPRVMAQPGGHHCRASSSVPTSSARSSPQCSPVQQQDNLSSEGLIPSSNNSHPSTVRFHENWI